MLVLNGSIGYEPITGHGKAGCIRRAVWLFKESGFALCLSLKDNCLIMK